MTFIEGCHHRHGSVLIDLKPPGGVLGMPLKMNPFEGTIHELVHNVVQNNFELRSRLQKFVDDHKTELTKWNDSDNALYWKLDIPMPSYYCTHVKDKKAHPEELLTMFFTCLISDTTMRYDMNSVIRTGTDFARKYPDYFNGMMNVLRGLKK
jgi:hypothetical protein